MHFKFSYINGRLIETEKALIPLTDLGFLRGHAVFDFFRVSNGEPVFLDDHLRRFEHSGAMLNLKIPTDLQQLKEDILKFLRRNEISDAGIRLLLTGGFSENGFSGNNPNLYIMAYNLPEYPDRMFTDGVKLLTQEYHREFSEAKTTNYSMAASLETKMNETKAEDVLYHQNGVFSETSRANFFIVDNNDTIQTAGDDILKGITRHRLLKIAKSEFSIRLEPIAVDSLDSVKEAFITSTTKGVMPVNEIDDLIIGSGKCGEVTRRLSMILEEYIRSRHGSLNT